MTNPGIFEALQTKLNSLGAKLNVFIQSVESGHISVREETEPYGTTRDTSP